MNDLNATEHAYLEEKWNELCDRIREKNDGLDPARTDSIFNVLKALYSDPRREYHNLRHICECLGYLTMRDMSEYTDKTSIELAIWFHDAFYTFSPGHDEKMSQDLAISMLKNLPVDRVKISDLINLTNGHHEMRVQNGSTDYLDDGAIFTDIDLAILGAKELRYKEYSKAIISEYVGFHMQMIPLEEAGSLNDLVLSGRAKFLKGMLSRDKIYSTYRFRQLFEENARKNIRAELEEINDNLIRP